MGSEPIVPQPKLNGSLLSSEHLKYGTYVFYIPRKWAWEVARLIATGLPCSFTEIVIGATSRIRKKHYFPVLFADEGGRLQERKRESLVSVWRQFCFVLFFSNRGFLCLGSVSVHRNRKRPGSLLRPKGGKDGRRSGLCWLLTEFSHQLRTVL